MKRGEGEIKTEEDDIHANGEKFEKKSVKSKESE